MRAHALTEFDGEMKEHKAEVRRRLTHTFPSPEALIQTYEPTEGDELCVYSLHVPN